VTHKNGKISFGILIRRHVIILKFKVTCYKVKHLVKMNNEK